MQAEVVKAAVGRLFDEQESVRKTAAAAVATLLQVRGCGAGLQPVVQAFYLLLDHMCHTAAAACSHDVACRNAVTPPHSPLAPPCRPTRSWRAARRPRAAAACWAA